MFGEHQKVKGRVLAVRAKPNWQRFHEFASSAPHQYVVEYHDEEGILQKAEFEQSVPALDANWVFPTKGQKVPLLVHHSGKVELDTRGIKHEREAARANERAADDAAFERERPKH